MKRAAFRDWKLFLSDYAKRKLSRCRKNTRDNRELSWECLLSKKHMATHHGSTCAFLLSLSLSPRKVSINQHHSMFTRSKIDESRRKSHVWLSTPSLARKLFGDFCGKLRRIFSSQWQSVKESFVMIFIYREERVMRRWKKSRIL